MKTVTSGARAALAALTLLIPACYGSDFLPTEANYTPRPRSEDSVQLLTTRPEAGYHEVGLITATGAGFAGAVKRVKQEAAQQGCDAVFLKDEFIQSGGGTPGGAYGMTKNHMRAICFVATGDAATPSFSGSAPAAAPGSQVAQAATCTPECRRGFDCVGGQCVSACNPACPSGQTCDGHGNEATCRPGGP